MTTKTGAALIGLGLATTTYQSQDFSFPNSTEYPGSIRQEYWTDGFFTFPVPEGYGNIYPTRMEKKHTPDQEAMSEFVKEYGKKGVSNANADTLLDWAEEYDFPHRDDRGKVDDQKKPHWEGGEHIHLGPKHIKVK